MVQDTWLPPLCFESSRSHTSCMMSVPPPPSTLRSDLSAPFCHSWPAHVHLVSEEFPWTLEVHKGVLGAEPGVACQNVLAVLYAALQAPLTDSRWGFRAAELRKRIIKSWKRRLSGARAI